MITRTACRCGRTLLVAAAVSLVPRSVAVAQSLIKGTLVDGVRSEPVSSALIEVAGSITISVRSDEAGVFRLALAPGSYRLRVRRVGFLPKDTIISATESSQSLVLAIQPDARLLARFNTVGSGTGVFGSVASATSLRPLSGARVWIAGAGKETVTDSAGDYFVSLKKGGTYIGRVSRPGYADDMFIVRVRTNQIVEVSRLIQQGVSMAGGEGLWKDFDNRLRWRAMNSALVPGSELRDAGAQLEEALLASPSFVSRGLRLGTATCVFVDGVPRPGLALDAIRLDDVSVVEAYGNRGDATSSLRNAWPPGQPCAASSRSRSLASAASATHFVVIWTRK